MNLLDFCVTERQTEVVKAYLDSGCSSVPAAKILGVTDRSIRHTVRVVKERAARSGYDFDRNLSLPVMPSHKNAGVSYRFDMVDGQPVIKGGWVLGREDKTETQDAVDSILASLNKKFKAQPVRKSKVERGLVNFIVGDHHHGMLAWFREVLANWDCNISESYFKNALLYLISQAPKTDTCALIILGDFFHAENFEGVTHKSKNPLDTDGRFTNMYETGADMLLWGIEQLRRHYGHVHFIYAAGNHDIIPSRTVRHALQWRYSDVDDVTIHDNARYFIPFVFEQNFFLIHHGDKTKMQGTYDVAIRDHIELLAKTKHHYGYTGHIHQQRTIDKGMLIESFRILAPQDQYAHDGGWSNKREMQARYYHPSLGCRTIFYSNGEELSEI